MIADKKIRIDTAARVLTGMLASTPLIDRTKINTRVWCEVAVDWADKLIEEVYKTAPD